MALDTRISANAAIAACNAIVDLIDGASPGLLRIYTAPRPADPDAAATGTLLAEITLNNPAFASAIDANPGGRATADVDPALQDISANAGGTAAWFRVVNSAGTGIIDGEVGTSGADLNLTTTTIVAGQPVQITSWTVTMPQT